MARPLSAYNHFVRDVQRALPSSATWADRQRAMQTAGRLWRSGKRTASDVLSAMGGRRSARPAGSGATGGTLALRTNPMPVGHAPRLARVRLTKRAKRTTRRNPKSTMNATLFSFVAGAIAGKYGPKLLPAETTAKLPVQVQQAIPYAVPMAGGALGAQLGGERVDQPLEILLYGVSGYLGDMVAKATIFKPRAGA